MSDGIGAIITEKVRLEGMMGKREQAIRRLRTAIRLHRRMYEIDEDLANEALWAALEAEEEGDG